LVVRKAEVFREKQDINLLTGHGVESIDPGKQTVSVPAESALNFPMTGC